jgi:hypothetical protein
MNNRKWTRFEKLINEPREMPVAVRFVVTAIGLALGGILPFMVLYSMFGGVQ